MLDVQLLIVILEHESFKCEGTEIFLPHDLQRKQMRITHFLAYNAFVFLRNLMNLTQF